ncbi:putative peptide modification system cyclase [Lysobacter sp. 2RAF19]
MNDFAQAGFDPASSPQVRTLLLTDLCDSTLLVERLGDTPAAALFRAHDRLVLELQQRWRGRLIDRSDGLLLLFERPVDGLGFALDYARGLRELGDRPEVRDRKLLLQARAGLHVGEVLTWQNSEAAVQAGAKPLEVEGLAKPLAGRLMTLARPGQILLSATAEPLARRAARELGERSEHLIWKSHGRWRFKGVPDGQEVFEVGEPGYAPLRAPKQNGGKAWRDIPVWRRPTALAAELFLVAGIATGAWFLTRPTPAIAFNERDWVVVGDLRNLTGQPVLDESLEQAFRISLEQSRYVNVLSDLKVRDTLALMKRTPGTTLDREIASEIAIRDGARAVILPTVSEVGGRVRVSAEVIDPRTQTTVYSETSDGTGAASALASIDEVTGQLRENLGEAIASIQRDSQPLPQASTANLDALKAYALGLEKVDNGDMVGGLGFYRRALELDPDFALARMGVGGVLVAQGKLKEGKEALIAASQMKDRLTPRETLALQTQIARFGPTEPLLARWEQLTQMYPDYLSAQFGYAQDSWMMANRFEQALPAARAATARQSAMAASAFYLQGILLLGQEDLRGAIAAFDRAQGMGLRGAAMFRAKALQAQGRIADADKVFGARGGTSLMNQDLESLEWRFISRIDRGEFADAREALDRALKVSGKEDPYWADTMWQLYAAGIDLVTEGSASADTLARRLDWVNANSAKLDETYPMASTNQRLAMGWLAARSGHAAVLSKAIAALGERSKVAGYPLAEQTWDVLLAEQDRMAGKSASAIARLSPIARRPDALQMVHVANARALTDAGQWQGAVAEWHWVATHRGRAFAEPSTGGMLDPLTIAETRLAPLEAASLLASHGQKKRAEGELAAFDKAWRPEGLPRALHARREAARASLLRE